VADGLFRKPLKPSNILKEDEKNINNFINSELNLVRVAPVITRFRTIKARAYLIIIVEGRIKELEEDPRENKEKKRTKKEEQEKEEEKEWDLKGGEKL
jgi:hypothetical protein